MIRTKGSFAKIAFNVYYNVTTKDQESRALWDEQIKPDVSDWSEFLRQGLDGHILVVSAWGRRFHCLLLSPHIISHGIGKESDTTNSPAILGWRILSCHVSNGKKSH